MMYAGAQGTNLLDAPEVQYVHDAWSRRDGLPQSMVVDVVQTQDGYLGMATYDGRARFDGGRFTTFNSARTPAISYNRIGALAEARDGTR